MLKFAGAFSIILSFVVAGFGDARAQTQSAPPATTPEPLAAPPVRLKIQAGGLKSRDAAASFALGWNYRVCNRSIWHSPDSLTSIVWAYNTDGSRFYFITTSSPGQFQPLTPGQSQLQAACQNGARGYWIFITNLATLAYSAVMIAY